MYICNGEHLKNNKNYMFAFGLEKAKHTDKDSDVVHYWPLASGREAWLFSLRSQAFIILIPGSFTPRVSYSNRWRYTDSMWYLTDKIICKVFRGEKTGHKSLYQWPFKSSRWPVTTLKWTVATLKGIIIILGHPSLFLPKT